MTDMTANPRPAPKLRLSDEDFVRELNSPAMSRDLRKVCARRFSALAAERDRLHGLLERAYVLIGMTTKTRATPQHVVNVFNDIKAALAADADGEKEGGA
jgi:hypothetical protein